MQEGRQERQVLLLRRQIARRFGDATAEQLSEVLDDPTGLDNIDRVTAALTSVKLMRQGAGVAEGQEADVVGPSLDHLIGTWSRAEADEIDEAARHYEANDEGVWE